MCSTQRRPAYGPFSTISLHELDAEAAAAVLVEHVDVREIDEARGVAVDRPGEADLAAVPVEADDARARVDQLVLPLARSSLRPVRLAPEVRVHGVAVETRPVVVSS